MARRSKTLLSAVVLAAGLVVLSSGPSSAGWFMFADETHQMLDEVRSVVPADGLDAYAVMVLRGEDYVWAVVDRSHGTARITRQRGNKVVSDAIVSEGVGTWSSSEPTPDVEADLAHLGKPRDAWLFTPDPGADLPADVLAARFEDRFDWVSRQEDVYGWTQVWGEPRRVSFHVGYNDDTVHPETGYVDAGALIIDRDDAGTLVSATDWAAYPEDAQNGTNWSFVDVEPVTVPSDDASYTAEDLQRAHEARNLPAVTQAQAMTVARAANARARAAHRPRTRLTDVAAVARARHGAVTTRTGLTVRLTPTRRGVRVSSRDPYSGRRVDVVVTVRAGRARIA